MAELTDFTEDEIIKHFFRTGDMASVSVMAIALLTTLADDNDSGIFTSSTGVEVPSSNAYERANDANTGGGASNTTNPLDANWTATAAGDGQTDNATAIAFAAATGNWGTIVGVGLCSSATHNAGDLYFHSPVDIGQAITSGQTVEFAIGDITVTID